MIKLLYDSKASFLIRNSLTITSPDLDVLSESLFWTLEAPSTPWKKYERERERDTLKYSEEGVDIPRPSFFLSTYVEQYMRERGGGRRERRGREERYDIHLLCGI